jgi:hypothetical protein
VSELPNELKNDAFEYEGLGSTRVRSFKDIRSGGGEPAIGTMQATLKSLSNGKATFEEESTGGIDGGMTEDGSLEKGGYFANSISPGKLLTPHSIELPANLTPGYKWSSSFGVQTTNGDVMKLKMDNQVIGRKSIKLGAVTTDALEIDGQDKGTVGATPVSITTQAFYVKGVGLVRNVQKMSREGKVTTFTREFSLTG